jgi:uncharacterized protein involved in outer membrane biogenesis
MNKKSLVKSIVIGGALLAVLLGGGIGAIYLLCPPEKIAALILPQAERAMGRRITVESAGFSFFPRPGLSLSGLTIENTEREGFSRAPFITVEKATACISLGSLFTGHPEITRIVLKRPAFRIEVSEQGAFNFDDLAPKDSAERAKIPAGIPVLPIPLTLERLVIRDGSLIYDNRKMDFQATVGRFDQEARIAIDRSLQDVTTDGTLRLGDIALNIGGLAAPLTGLTVTMTHDISADLPAGTVTVNRITASSGKLTCTISGTVKDVLTRAPMLDLTLSAPPIAMQDLVSLLPASLLPFAPHCTASGTLTTGARLQGTMLPGKPSLLSGSVKLTEVMVRYAGCPESINNVNAAIEFTDKSITVDSLAMRFGTSPITVTAVITDLAKRLFDATIKGDVNLDEVKEVVSLPPGVSLGGRVTADIRADGVVDPDDPCKLYCTGHIDLRQVSFLMPPLAHPAAINGQITFAREGGRAHCSMAFEQSSLAFDAAATHYLYFLAPPGMKNVKRPSIDCNVISPNLDLDGMLNLSASAPAGAHGAAAAPDVLLAAAPLPGVDLHAALAAKELRYKGFAMSGFTAKISSGASFAEAVIASGFSTGTIENALHVDIRKANAIAFADKFSVKNVELNDLMARFGDLVQPVTPLNAQLAQINKGLYGRVSIQGTLHGEGDSPDRITNSLAGAVTIRMAEGKLENTPVQKRALAAFSAFLKAGDLVGVNPINFREFSTSTHIADRRVTFDDLQILSDLGDWKAHGSVGFDAAMDMAVSTRLSRQLSGKVLDLEGGVKSAAKNLLAGTQLAGAAGLLDNVSLIPHDKDGRITLRCALSGTVSDPRVGELAFGDIGREKQPSAASSEQNEAQRQATEQIKKAGAQIGKALRGLFQ